jgi:ABC-type multidrug transport system ATPase subunit
MVCDRVAILVDGLVARQGTLDELTEETVEYRITFSGEPQPIGGKLRELGASVDGNAVMLPGHDVGKVNELIDLMRGAGLLIESVQPQRFSLEDILAQVLAGRSTAAPTVPLAKPVQR